MSDPTRIELKESELRDWLKHIEQGFEPEVKFSDDPAKMQADAYKVRGDMPISTTGSGAPAVSTTQKACWRAKDIIFHDERSCAHADGVPPNARAKWSSVPYTLPDGRTGVWWQPCRPKRHQRVTSHILGRGRGFIGCLDLGSADGTGCSVTL